MSFKHVAWRPLPYSMGVPIGSDWQDKAPDDPIFGLYRTCGFWTRAEEVLLGQVTYQFNNGRWLEIGAHTGWCTDIIANRNNFVVAIEPMFSIPEWYSRFVQNITIREAINYLRLPIMDQVMPWAGRSDQYFACWDGGGGRTFDGCLIDGDHVAPHPLNDAIGCFDRLNERGVILLHDFRGPDIWDAAKYLVDHGMQYKVYPSVHMVCVCWRGEFTPPPVFQEGTVDWVKHYGLPDWCSL